MTNLINQVCEKIETGLKAVSESGRRMVALDTRYNSITEAVAQVVEEIKSLSGHIYGGVSRFGDPAAQVERIVSVLQNILVEMDRRQASVDQSISAGVSRLDEPTERLNRVVELLSQIRVDVGRRANQGSIDMPAVASA